MRVDLQTVVIPRERKMWVVHPGKNKKFFADFRANNRIFLEYPGLDLNERLIGDDPELRRRIRYSLDLIRNEGLVRPNGSQIRLADFEGDAKANVAVYMRTVKHLFTNMQPGDLVIVPGWGAYAPVLFGEVVGDVNFNLRDRIFPHMFADIQFRNVKWLSTSRTKPELGELVRFVNKPPAIAEVARDAETERFFDFAYDAYVMDGQSWSTITAPRYRSNDPGAISDSLKVIEFAVATFRAIESGQDISGLSLDEVIERFYSTEDIEHFGLSYASPGRLDFRSRNARLSLWVAVMIALSGAGALTGCKASAEHISIENSKTQSPELNAHIEGQVDVLVGQISEPTAVQVERMGQHAQQATGITSPVEVKS